MTELYITIGMPASGKTTWAEGFKKSVEGVVNLCRDDIRIDLYGPDYQYSKEREKCVIERQFAMATDAVTDAVNYIVVSDTNLNPSTLQRWLDFARNDGLTVHTVDFRHVSIEECIRRNSKRRGAARINKQEIINMAIRYKDQLGQEAYDFDSDPNWTYVPNPLGQRAVIVDIDGTLAHMLDRDPYDFSKVIEDAPDEQIIELVAMYRQAGYKVIIMTGREEVCKDDTEMWLSARGIKYERLYMRPADEPMKDWKLKAGFLKDVENEGKYKVKLVIDDRDCVVRMWRHVGLKCLQVAEGNF